MKNGLSVLDTALALLDRGLWPVTLHAVGSKLATKIATGKEPIGTDWGKVRPTEASIREMFRQHPDAGLGLLLGPEGGLIDIEGDGPEAEESRAKLMGGEVVETLGWSSRRGRHRLFRWNARLAVLGKIKTELAALPGLEIRTGLAGKQAQSACPPTPGEDETLRQWNESDTIAELPEAAILYLESVMARRKEPPFAGKATNKRAEPSDRNAAWFRKALESEAGKVAMAYEGSRNDALHKAAGTLGGMIHHGHLTEPEIVAELTVAGRRAGLEEAEIARTIDSGLRWGKANPMAWPEKLTPLATNMNGHHHETRFEAQPDDDDDIPLPPPDWPAPPGQLAYHGLLGEAVQLIADHTEADPLGILSQLVVAFGNAAGRGPCLRVDGTRHGLNEFLVIVGETAAARKGTSWNRAQAFLQDADPEWLKGRIRSGLSSGEGLITPVRDAVMAGGKLIDEGEPDKRLLIVETELGSLLRVLQREGNRISPLMRNAWDGVDLATMTKAPIRATEPHISFIGHSTSEELKSLLSGLDISNGLANRIVWLCVKRTKFLPFGGADVDLRPIREQFRDALEFARGVGEMILTTEAKSVYATNYVRLSTPPPGTLGEATSRAAAHVLRWSMIYALADQSPVVDAVHIQAAMEIIDASNRAAAHIFGDTLGNSDAEKILAGLRSSREGLSRTDINKVVFQSHLKTKRIRQALTFLLSYNLVREVRLATAGRDKMIYHACEKSETSEESGKSKADSSHNSLFSLFSHPSPEKGATGREVFEV